MCVPSSVDLHPFLVFFCLVCGGFFLGLSILRRLESEGSEGGGRLPLVVAGITINITLLWRRWLSSSLGAMWVVFRCGDTSEGGLLICSEPARRDRVTLAFFIDTGDNGVLVSSSSPPPNESLEATLRLSRRTLLFLRCYTSRANGW